MCVLTSDDRSRPIPETHRRHRLTIDRLLGRERIGDGETLPMLAGLVKRVTIERQPGMTIKAGPVLPHPAMKRHRVAGSCGEPIQRQRPGKAIPFRIVGKKLEPPVHIVDEILEPRRMGLPGESAGIQPLQHRRKTLPTQSKANPGHDRSHLQQHPIFSNDSLHRGLTVTSRPGNSSHRRRTGPAGEVAQPSPNLEDERLDLNRLDGTISFRVRPID